MSQQSSEQKSLSLRSRSAGILWVRPAGGNLPSIVMNFRHPQPRRLPELSITSAVTGELLYPSAPVIDQATSDAVFWVPCWYCSRCSCLLLWFMLLLLLTFQDCSVPLEDEDILLAMGPLRLTMWSEYRGNCLEYEMIWVWRRGSVPEIFFFLIFL